MTRQCKNGHDITYSEQTKLVRVDGRYRRRCRQCLRDRRQRERETRKRESAPARTTEAVDKPESKRLPVDVNSPFMVTMRQMEGELRRSYVTWTREEHLEHTQRIYAHLGWPDGRSTLPPRSDR